MKKKIFMIVFLCMLVIIQHGIAASAKTDTDYDGISIRPEKDVEKYHIPGMAVMQLVENEKLIWMPRYQIILMHPIIFLNRRMEIRSP